MQQKPWDHAIAFSPALTDDQVLRSGLGISGALSHLILTATPQSLSISSFLKTRELGRRMPGEPSRHHEVAGWSRRAARRPAACPGCTQRREPGTLARPGEAAGCRARAGHQGPHRVTELGGPVRRGRGRGGEQPGKQSQHRAQPHRFHPQTSHFPDLKAKVSVSEPITPSFSRYYLFAYLCAFFAVVVHFSHWNDRSIHCCILST